MIELQNNLDDTEMSYKFLCDMIDSIDNSLDNTIMSVFQTENYVQNLISSCKLPQTESSKKNIPILMAPFLLKALNNPFFDVVEVKEISKSTGLTERQIRDFLRNQRKRQICYLNQLHDAERENIETKIGYLESFINQAVNEYLNIRKTEAENEIGALISFPSNA